MKNARERMIAKGNAMREGLAHGLGWMAIEEQKEEQEPRSKKAEGVVFGEVGGKSSSKAKVLNQEK